METSPGTFRNPDQEYSFNNFIYNEGYRKLLQELRDDNAGSIRPFTTPVVMEFMRLMVKNGLLDEYLRWIRDIVDVFSVCYHFMYPNRDRKLPGNTSTTPTTTTPWSSDMMVDYMFNGKPPGTRGFRHAHRQEQPWLSASPFLSGS